MPRFSQPLEFSGFREGLSCDSTVGQRGRVSAVGEESICSMTRRTFRNLKAKVAAQKGELHHHHVYVVLLDAKAADWKTRKTNPKRDPAKPCVYVGMTGLKPEERFANHKKGIKAARVVTRHGKRLLPALYECLNPM